MSRVAILVGSVYGGAEDLADNTVKFLTDNGHQVELFNDSSLNDVLAADCDYWLVITSTTGQGDVPANLEPLFFELKDITPNLRNKQYAVICLGDSSYRETYCEAGKQFDEIMYETMAKRTQDRLEIDACETMDTIAAAADWLAQYSAKISV